MEDGVTGKVGFIGEVRRAFEPLKERDFRRIWLAGLLSSFGQLIFGVAVAWEVARLSNAPKMVALVQSAMMVPLTLITLPAGALADMFDRRKIAMFGLGFAATSAAVLALAGFLGVLSPEILLVSCVLVGTGTALYIPSWQSSIPEQVSSENLPAAVGLSALGANVARSFGPAVGGVIILVAGAKTAFALTAACFIPLFMAYFFWQRRLTPPRLPPEQMHRAIAAGVRYAIHSPVVRIALIRVFIFALIIAPGPALAPLVAKDVLSGDALTLGALLGAQGIGAVMAVLLVGYIRSLLTSEIAVRWLSLGCGLALVGIGLSDSLWLTAIAFFGFGACFIATLANINVDVQLSASRWVAARVVSLYASAIFAGQGLGAWFWGTIADGNGLGPTFIAAGLATTIVIGFGFAMPLTGPTGNDQGAANVGVTPDIAMNLTLRSGPIVIEIIYNVEPARARQFYAEVLELRAVRHRIGGYDWSLSRNIADPAIWIERFHCSTWGDYLRMRERYSAGDMELQKCADAYHRETPGPRIARRLERPFGSVRWSPDSFDPEKELTVLPGSIGIG